MIFKYLQKTWLAWLIICAVTFVIYSGTLNYDILYGYDDDAYLHDPRISQLNGTHLKDYFSDYYLGMYQPIPVLSFAVADHLFPGSIPVQRLIQILLHCLNVLLVLVLVKKLTGNFFVGTLTALLFAIHPMHVESVSWLATRSNLVYSCFYMLALILYMKWQDDNRWLTWVLMLLCFILSLFSKVTAATFPMAVILIDWFRNRKFTPKMFLLYIPLILLSGVFIKVGISASGAFGHIEELGDTYTPADRVAVLLDALWLYLVKAIVPYSQSVIYLYPWKIAGSLPVAYYILGILALVIVMSLLVKGWMMRNKPEGRMIIFWLLFFLITISIVMPLKWSRTILIAERYTYIPYIGLFALIFSMAFRYIGEKQILRRISIILLGCIVVLFSFLSWNRNKVWQSPLTLFGDVIKKNRSGAEVSMGYYNRGNEYLRQSRTDLAIRDYTDAVNINSDYADAFYNRGVAYYTTGKYEEAIDDFSNTLSLKGDVPDARINRSIAYRALGDYTKALEDLDYVIGIHHDRLAYFNRGLLYYFNLQEPDKACWDWDESARLGFQQAEEYLAKYCQ